MVLDPTGSPSSSLACDDVGRNEAAPSPCRDRDTVGWIDWGARRGQLGDNRRWNGRAEDRRGHVKGSSKASPIDRAKERWVGAGRLKRAISESQ